MTNPEPGIDAEAVTSWYTAHVPGIHPPLNFSKIAGGHSNLTYLVTDAEGGRSVLRRPPLGQVLQSAHDMGREHRIISALGPTDIPVPPALGYVADDSVNGAPFYVMDFVEGLIVKTADQAENLSMDARRRSGEALIDVMAAIHDVDVDAVGLGDLGRKEGYIERQLKRWNSQWLKSKTRELPAIERVHEVLSARIPEQGKAAIVHGDYRLDNCMITPAGEVAAVLDWELCTLGDPLADLGLLMVYWTEAGDEGSALAAAPTAIDGFVSRAALVERYAAASGRDVSQVDFYTAFGYWKLACIVEGVYARYLGGSMGSTEDEASQKAVAAFSRQVESLADSALHAVERLG